LENGERHLEKQVSFSISEEAELKWYKSLEEEYQDANGSEGEPYSNAMSARSLGTRN